MARCLRVSTRTNVRRGSTRSILTPGSLLKYQIVPFKAAIDAGTSAIMPYYNRPSNALSGAQLPEDWRVSPTQQFEEVGGAYNQTLLTKLLRGTLGFKGYVNTDSGVLSNTDWGVDALTVPQRFAKSIKAGANIFGDNNDPSGLLDAVKQGLLDGRGPSISRWYSVGGDVQARPV